MLSNKTKRIFGLFLLMMMLCSLMVTSIYAAPKDLTADGSNKVVTFKDDTITPAAIYKEMSGSDSGTIYENGNYSYTKSGTLFVTTKGTEYALLTVGTNQIIINPKAFKEAKNNDVINAMRKFTDSISDLGADDDTVQQIMTDIQDTDPSVSSIMLPLIFKETRGDMYQAYKITSPFLEILSVVLGVGAVILILLLLFSTVMDMAYIGLPVWREAQASKDGGKKNPFGVSYEAILTVEEVEKGIGGGDAGYKNAYLLYFKRRALTYIILAICIMYLICGGLSGIIGFVLQLVSGITG